MFLDASALVVDNRPRSGSAIAVTDLDGDGRFEFVVSGHACPNLVLHWDGRRLINIADPVIADVQGEAIALAAGDVDGDGREELYILNGDRSDRLAGRGAKPAPDRLFTGFGRQWLDLLAQPENFAATQRTPGRVVAALDRWGQGRYGFVVAAGDGSLRLYEMDKDGRLSDGAEAAGLDLQSSPCGLLPLPLVGGRQDLVVLNESDPHLLFRNDGNGVFEECGDGWGFSDGEPRGRGAAILDGDGTGHFDLAVAAWRQPNRLFVQQPRGGFADVAPPELAEPGRVRSVIAADFDNDGFQELFFTLFGEPNRLFAWRSDRWTAIDSGDAALPDGFGTGAAVADIDGDGRLELLVAHGEAADQPLALFRPFPTAFGWLRVMPLTSAGAPARGAVVLCRAGGRTQGRVICGGSGAGCQMEPVAHFGLGELTRVTRVEVRWPDGAVVVVQDPPLGRVLTVPHPPL
ncbi:MAG: CRTAC1 family protein [Azospirillaceae bacterium]|nr:CRTAC1 family protein [Azospirillaceae bacterium]